MRLMLPDLVEETCEKYDRYLSRAQGQLKRENWSSAVRYLQLALSSAMDHGQDFLCRKLLVQAKQGSVQNARVKPST